MGLSVANGIVVIERVVASGEVGVLVLSSVQVLLLMTMLMTVSKLLKSVTWVKSAGDVAILSSSVVFTLCR